MTNSISLLSVKSHWVFGLVEPCDRKIYCHWNLSYSCWGQSEVLIISLADLEYFSFPSLSFQRRREVFLNRKKNIIFIEKFLTLWKCSPLWKSSSSEIKFFSIFLTSWNPESKVWCLIGREEKLLRLLARLLFEVAFRKILLWRFDVLGTGNDMLDFCEESDLDFSCASKLAIFTRLLSSRFCKSIKLLLSRIMSGSSAN